MTKIKLLGVAAAAALLQVTAAHATLLDWSYTAADGTTGGGTFTADQDPMIHTNYHVTSATGTINGQTITAVTSFDFADDLAFPTSPILIDSNGIGLSAGGSNFNIFEDDGLFDPGSPFDCGAVYCIEGPVTAGNPADPVQALTSLSIALDGGPVPEPATWAMMLVGFGGLGAMMRMRRRLATA